MKNLDRITGIVLFLIGLGICLKSLTYTVGSLRSPHAGFFPLLNSFIMMGLSALMTVQTFLKKDTGEASKARFSPSEGASKRIIIGFMILVGFRYLLAAIGFGPSTFIFIFCLAKFISHFNWKASIFFSVLTSLTAYYLFQVFLKIPFPGRF